MALNSTPSLIQVQLFFLKRSKLYEKVKPYRIFYSDSTVSPEMMSNEEVEAHMVNVRNIWDAPDNFSVEKNGFAIRFLDPPSYDLCVRSADHQTHPNIQREPIAPYCQSVAKEVKQYLGATDVIVIEYRYRKSHPEFPLAPGQPYSHGQPAMTVHIDTTTDDTRSRYLSLFHNTWVGKAKWWLVDRWKTRFMWINAWTRIVEDGGRVSNQWPLALCDLSSGVIASDLEPTDVVTKDGCSEQAHVYYHPNRHWYYLEAQQPGQTILFVQNDSSKHSAAVPHGSFRNPLSREAEPPRESLECSMIVRFKRAPSIATVAVGVCMAGIAIWGARRLGLFSP